MTWDDSCWRCCRTCLVEWTGCASCFLERPTDPGEFTDEFHGAFSLAAGRTLAGLRS